MKFKAAAGMLLAATLVACGGSPKAQPDIDAVTEGIQSSFDEVFPPFLGQRIQLESWDKLKYNCTDVEADVKRMKCVLGGKITIAGYRGGVQTAEGLQEVDPEFDLEFAKRGEGQWVKSKTLDK